MKQSKITIIAMMFAILYSIGLIWQAGIQPPEKAEELQVPQLGYAQRIFESGSVHIIDIQVTPQDWSALKKDALSKECIDSTVVIDGQQLCHVGLRTKGNSTLLFNAAKGWDRFSLVLEFDAFQESQRYYGLDQLSLYNNMFDASCMKTYLCYEMMRSLGVPAPLCSFAAVHLNGEFVGIYAASETFSQSFALRNFGYDHGQIYKPEQFDLAAIMTGRLQNTKLNLEAFSGSGGFTIDSALTISNDAVRLAYLGESLYAYEDIWRNTTFPIGISDKERVVNALRRLSQDESPEEVVDLDALARYFAVNTFVLNTDCYTTSMAHNYGLYEHDGVLSMLPWDYDVALGNIGSEFGVSDPSIFINQPIDTPVFSTTVAERPMLQVLLESEAGLEAYHRYLDQLVNLWIDSGKMAAEIDRLAQMLQPWIARETITVYSQQEHLQAVESIWKFTAYRGESIRQQLDGTIPATWAEQEAQPETLPDYSDFSPPESGIMKVLLPDLQGEEVSGAALLQVLPQANANMHSSVSLPALMNLIDLKQVLTMERPVSDGKESSLSSISKADLLAAVMPYPLIALKLLLTALAVPAVMIWGLRFARRWHKKRGGIRHVV